VDLQEVEAQELTPAKLVLRDAIEVLDEHRLRATNLMYISTVGDVIRTTDNRQPCRLGKRQSLSWRGSEGGREGRIRNAYRLCGGAKCPRCAPGYLFKMVRRAVAAWGDDLDQVHRVVFNGHEWVNGRSARRVKEDFRFRMLRVKHAATGDQVVYVPGPVEGSVELNVDELGRAITEDLLLAPVTGRRYAVPSRTADGEKVDVDGVVEEKEKPRVVNLPKRVDPEDVNELVNQALGRELAWEKKGGGGTNFKSYEAGELWPTEIDLVRETVTDPLGEEAELEKEEKKQARELAKQFADFGWNRE
jgi:hypothetical protein